MICHLPQFMLSSIDTIHKNPFGKKVINFSFHFELSFMLNIFFHINDKNNNNNEEQLGPGVLYKLCMQQFRIYVQCDDFLITTQQLFCANTVYRMLYLLLVWHFQRLLSPEPRNRFPAWRNRFLESLHVYKYAL